MTRQRIPVASLPAALLALCAGMSAGAHPLQKDVPLMISGSPYASASILANRNIVVVDPDYSCGGKSKIGVVYLLTPDGTVVSMLTGRLPLDRVGSGGIAVLANGNFVVKSPSWACSTTEVGCGAATWVSGSLGRSGQVDASNSLVGSGYDVVGRDVTPLRDGSYLVRGDGWSVRGGQVGTLTLGNGSSGSVGTVSAANSWAGNFSGDLIGDFVVELPGGDIVVASPKWAGGAGAVTQIARANLSSGVITAANSLVGGAVGDNVGSGPPDIGGAAITVLSNGNYVVCSPSWQAKRGAATWVNRNSPLMGRSVGITNSLVGSSDGDQICSAGAVALEGNGNYVVASVNVRRDNAGLEFLGAATWGNGQSGVTGEVSPANSLFARRGDPLKQLGVFALRRNGNYVVFGRGAGISDGTGYNPVAWGNGASGGPVGYLSSTNANYDDAPRGAAKVVPLDNGNYVIARTSWSGGKGLVVWGSGMSGAPVGPADAMQGLAGSMVGDFIGTDVTALKGSGAYVVQSPEWAAGRGAITWRPGTDPAPASVSTANSLVGPSTTSRIGGGLVVPLNNGSYVAGNPFWYPGNYGAWTWASGTAPTALTVDFANSVVGISRNDLLGTISASKSLSTGHVVLTAKFFDLPTLGTSDVGAACEYAGNAAISGGPNDNYCVIGTQADAGPQWSLIVAPVGRMWAVLRPSERLISIVTDTDVIFQNGFD